MKTLSSLAASVAFVAGLGLSVTLPLSDAFASDDAPEKTRVPMLKHGGADRKSNAKPETKEPEAKAEETEEPETTVAQAETAETDTSEKAETEIAEADAEPEATESDAAEAEAATETEDDKPSEADTEEDETMSTETVDEKTPEEQEAFRQTMHEGDIALGVCGARVSALMWFYEASIAQGRDDLKAAALSLKESREALKKEAERRAVEDGVDTSVRVMNSESEKLWNNLNEKAGGDEKEFQKAHDELFAGVQECLALFFARPGDDKAKE